MGSDTFNNYQDYVNEEISIRKKYVLFMFLSEMIKTSNLLFLEILQASDKEHQNVYKCWESLLHFLCNVPRLQRFLSLPML